MTDSIQTSTEAVAGAVSALESGTTAYVGFRLPILYPSLPVEGSSVHDDAVSTTVNEALDAWNSLMELDKKNIKLLQQTIAEADESSANGIAAG